MRYIPGVYQGVPNQREFRAAATGRPLQWDRSDQPAALAAYLNVASRSMSTAAGWGVLYPVLRGIDGGPKRWWGVGREDSDHWPVKPQGELAVIEKPKTKPICPWC